MTAGDGDRRFGFLNMMFTYKERKVDRYENNGLFVSTAKITDSSQPYETVIKHPQYDGYGPIPVEEYNTKEEAQKGHNKWVQIMLADVLPAELKDVSTCFMAQLVFNGINDNSRINPLVKETKRP